MNPLSCTRYGMVISRDGGLCIVCYVVVCMARKFVYELSPFVLCPDLFYVLSVSLIHVRNGNRRVFAVHLICDCCRACVVSCYIITWWRNPNVPVCLMFCVICSDLCELDQFPRDILNIVKLPIDHVLSMKPDFYGTSLKFLTLYWWNLHSILDHLISFVRVNQW